MIQPAHTGSPARARARPAAGVPTLPPIALLTEPNRASRTIENSIGRASPIGGRRRKVSAENFCSFPSQPPATSRRQASRRWSPSRWTRKRPASRWPCPESCRRLPACLSRRIMPAAGGKTSPGPALGRGDPRPVAVPICGAWSPEPAGGSSWRSQGRRCLVAIAGMRAAGRGAGRIRQYPAMIRP